MKYHDLSKEVANQFLRFCEQYFNKTCVIIDFYYKNLNTFSPPYLRVEVAMQEPISDMRYCTRQIGSILFVFGYPDYNFNIDEDEFYEEFKAFLLDDKLSISALNN